MNYIRANNNILKCHHHHHPMSITQSKHQSLMGTHPVQTYQGAQKVNPRRETIHTKNMPEDMSPILPIPHICLYPITLPQSDYIDPAGTKHSLIRGIIDANRGKHAYIMRPRCPCESTDTNALHRAQSDRVDRELQAYSTWCHHSPCTGC